MAEEIIKSVIEISLGGICVYAGAAIYNWGYCKGLNATSKRIAELEETNQKHYEYISRIYCENPFIHTPLEGPSFVTPKAIGTINEYIGIDKNNLKSKAKTKEVRSKEKKIK